MKPFPKTSQLYETVGYFCKAVNVWCFTGLQYASDKTEKISGALPVILQNTKN